MYTITLGLHTNKYHIDLYNKKLEFARKMYNILVKQCIKRLSALRQDKQYLKAIKEYNKIKNSTKKDDEARIKELKVIMNERVKFFKLTKTDLESFLDNDKNQYKKQLGSTSRQKVALRVYEGLEKVLYSYGKKLHFKKSGELLSIEGKSNKTDIRFKIPDGKFQYMKFESVDIKIKKSDLFNQEVLEYINQNKATISFCRLVKKYVKGKEKFYLQLIVKGEMPPKRNSDGSYRQKPTPTGERVGIDLGTSTIAVASNKKVILKELAQNIKKYNDEIIYLSRKLERSRRLHNPNNFNEDGTIKKGIRLNWVLTKNYKRNLFKLKDAYRRKSAYVKESHCNLANEILSLGDNIYTETMNFKALARKSTKPTEFNEKTGKNKRKKRFGKSILDKSPSLFLTILENKLKYEGAALKKVNTQTFKASQYNHIEDKYIKKPLSQRVNKFENTTIQRDLYSAYLLMNSNKNLKTTNKTLCKINFDTFIKNHNICINELKNKNAKYPLSFGLKKLIANEL